MRPIPAPVWVGFAAVVGYDTFLLWRGAPMDNLDVALNCAMFLVGWAIGFWSTRRRRRPGA